MPIGVLFSGGLDSAILVAILLEHGHSVQPIYIQSNLIWQSAELPSVRRFLAAMARDHALRSLIVLDLPLADLYEGHWSMTGCGVPTSASDEQAVFLPGRNALLTIKAALWCRLHGLGQLALAALGTSPFDDARKEYFDQFARVLNGDDGPPVEIVLPFAALDKRQVMEMGPTVPLDLTFSCIAPIKHLHCGQCNKCSERSQAFESVGRFDPTVYAPRIRSSCTE